MRETVAFYDDLADVYHLIYPDWNAAIERQASALDAIIRAHGAGKRVADVACGIGTQSLGLAARGYNVAASDLSPNAISRAWLEAEKRELPIDLRVDDMLSLETHATASADVLVACDNAVQHLPTDDAIRAAFLQFHRVLAPDGLLILSGRDYAAIPHEPKHFVPFGVRQVDGCSVALFQVWTWEDHDHYALDFYFVFDREDSVETRVFRATYYAISIYALTELLRGSGFTDVRRVDGQFFQPLIVARRVG